jgi:hypothetical protein
VKTSKPQYDEEGFIKPNPRSIENKKQRRNPSGNNLETQNKREGKEKNNKGA